MNVIIASVVHIRHYFVKLLWRKGPTSKELVEKKQLSLEDFERFSLTVNLRGMYSVAKGVMPFPPPLLNFQNRI